jgi:hypothetical protein
MFSQETSRVLEIGIVLQHGSPLTEIPPSPLSERGVESAPLRWKEEGNVSR